MGRVKRATRKKTRSPKYVVEQPSAKLSSYRKKSSDPSHRKTAADIFKEDPSYREAIDRVQTSETPEKPPTGSSVISSQVDQIGTEAVELQSLTGIVSDREEIDRVHSLRFYKTDDSYDPEEKDRVHSLRFYKTDDSYDREEKYRVHSLRFYNTDDSHDREEKDRVHSLRFYKTDDSYDREEKDRVHSLRFYNTDDSHDREEKDRVHSLRYYKTDDSYDREEKDRVHSLCFYKTDDSETPDFPKLSEKPPHGVISSQVNQIGTVSEVVKMAKDAQGSVVMSRTSGETNDSFTADLSLGVIKLGAPCRGERLAKYNQVFC